MTFIWQAAVPKRIGIWQLRFKIVQWQYFTYVLSKFDANIILDETAKSAYFTKYLSNYWTDLHQIFSVSIDICMGIIALT